jgi:outer membrane scaffolding protein for murein synthesis (MipA/OmpV family)
MKFAVTPRNRMRQAGFRLAGALCCAMLPLAASAELTNDSLFGPGLRYRPAYDGSRSQSAELVPVIRHFGDHWFVRSTQGVGEAGLRTAIVPGLHAGAQLAYEPGRKTSESAFLRNHQIDDIGAGVSAGLQLEWDYSVGPVPMTLLARVRQNVDSDRGAQMDLRFTTGAFHKGRFNAGIFAQATWADTKSTTSLYGIAPQQSVLTGLPAFQPGSGLLFTSVGLLWAVDLNPKWMVLGSLERRRLSGNVSRSPLVERPLNIYISAGVAYHY